MAKLMPNGKQQFFDANGDPLASGKVYTYAAGTSTPKDTYATYLGGGGASNANPVILDARGEATIFWDGAYKVVLKDSTDATIWTVDNISTLSSAADISYASSTIDVILKDHSCYVVNTINALKAVDKTKYTHCFVRGYYAAGDGGGGMYRYDSSDTSTVDDGGAVIVASDSARWKLIHNGTISIRQYGCRDYFQIGNLSGNEPLLQKAINYFNHSYNDEGKGGVLIVDGMFYLDYTSPVYNYKEVTLRGFHTPSNEAFTTNMYARSASTSGFIFSEAAANVTLYNAGRLENLFFCDADTYIGGSTATLPATFNAIQIGTTGRRYSQSCLILGCQFYGFATALTTNTTAPSGDTYYTCEYTVKDCVFSSCDTSIYHTSTEPFAVINCTQDNYGLLGRAVPPAMDYFIRVNNAGITDGIATIRDCRTLGAEYSVHITSSAAGYYLIENCDFDQYDAAAVVNEVVSSNITSGRMTLKDSVVTSYNSNNCVVITNGDYIIRDNTLNDSINLAAGADYGIVSGNTTQSITGDATAALKCVSSNLLATHTPTAWTPVLKHAGTERVTAYTTQVGQYTVHDNLVTAICNITVNTIAGGASGDAATITGLPFASAAGIKGGGYATYTAGLVTVVDGITADIAAGTQIASLYQGSATGSAVLTYADTVAGCTLNYVFQYFIDR